jgi:hypothetical protein
MVRGTAAAAATLVLLAGCATVAGDDAPGSTTEPVIPVGYKWAEVLFTGPLVTGIDYEGFSAGGMFWVYDQNVKTTLHGTQDGTHWRTVDAIENGVTPPGGDYRSDCSVVIADDGSASTFSMMYQTYYPQGHPASLTEHAWILEIDPERVSLSDGATNGLEVMPPDEGGYAYRTDCAWGMVNMGGKRVIVGDGQWWQPWETGNVNPFVAVEEAPGSWKVHASSQEPFFKDQVLLMHVTKAADRLVVLAMNSAVGSGLESWSSADAFHWDRVDFPGPPPGGGASLPEVASNEYGMAAWTTITTSATNDGHVWTTSDGATWTHSKLFDTDWELTAVRIDEGGFTAHAMRLDGEKFVSAVWHSVDGVTWTALDDENPYPHRLKSAIAHEGGLVLILDGKFLVSGLPWSAP